MKPRRSTFPAFLLLLAIGFFQAPHPALAQDPGSTGDPLVSKSYLDQLFRFRSLVIPAGDHIQPPLGALIVVRSGKLSLRCPAGKGLVDLTEGKPVPPGAVLPANHLILVPDSGSYTLEAKDLCLILAVGIPPEK